MRISLYPVYSVAKSFAVKGQLLPYSTLEELAESRSLEEFVDRLRITPYAQYVTELPRPYEQLSLEKAFRHSLVDLHYRLMNVTPRAHVISVYFYRYVASNLKTVLRAKGLGKSFDEIQAGLDLHAEELLRIRDEVVRAATAATMEETIEELKKTFLGVDASLAYSVWMEKADLSILDTAIDKAFYNKLLKAYKKTPRRERSSLKDFIEYEIDLYQIVTLLRAKTWEIPPATIREFILEKTFKLSSDIVDDIVESEGFEDAVKLLQLTEYGKFLPADVKNPEEVVTSIEKGVRDRIYKTAGRMYTARPFSLGVVMSTILLKEVEVKNLTTIAIGIAEKLPPSMIIQNLYRP